MVVLGLEPSSSNHKSATYVTQVVLSLEKKIIINNKIKLETYQVNIECNSNVQTKLIQTSYGQTETRTWPSLVPRYLCRTQYPTSCCLFFSIFRAHRCTDPKYTRCFRQKWNDRAASEGNGVNLVLESCRSHPVDCSPHTVL